jgi:hypothetical protein
MVARFYLDQSELDDADVGLGGPSPAFVLDTARLDEGVLDGTTFTTPAIGAANLGGLSASATATITPVITATADAPLGALAAEVAEVNVEVVADATTSLGGLVGVASGVVSVAGEASAGLGEATSVATGVITVVASAESLLGGVVASADGIVSADAVGDAPLGELTASAIGTVTPQPTPPQPQQQTGGRPYPYAQPRQKKREPEVEVVPEVVVPNPKTVLAYCTPIVASANASAVGDITFVAEEDDLQVLLML